MYIIKEPIDSVSYSSSYDDTYETLLMKLKAMQFHIHKQNKGKGEIIIPCLSSLMNNILWRVWGDKLLFEIKEIEKNKTKVDIFGIPYFFRIKVKKGEQLVDLDKLVSTLKLGG